MTKHLEGKVAIVTGGAGGIGSGICAAYAAQGARLVVADNGRDVEGREAIYRRLENPFDPLEWVFVSDVLNEGVDIPAINSVLFLRPTDSSTLFLQQLGRGLRLFPGTEVSSTSPGPRGHSRCRSRSRWRGLSRQR